MKGLKLIMIGVIILGLGSFAYAGEAGEKGSVFLKLGQGARAIGMGETFVAVADDINSLYWNPAGLTNINDITGTFMYSDWLAQIKYNYLGAVVPVEQLNGVIGASITFLDSGDIDKTDEGGNRIGTFEGKDLSLSISYARKLDENSLIDSIGGNLKYINRKIDRKESTGFAIDIGGMKTLRGVNGLKAGWCIQNIGVKTSAFVNDKDGLPLTIKAGIANDKLLNEALTLALDVNSPSDNKINVHLGAEYRFRKFLAFRVGFKTDTIDEHGTLSGITAGLGFKIPQANLTLDYAFVDYGKLDDTHRISLTFQR